MEELQLHGIMQELDEQINAAAEDPSRVTPITKEQQLMMEVEQIINYDLMSQLNSEIQPPTKKSKPATDASLYYDSNGRRIAQSSRSAKRHCNRDKHHDSETLQESHRDNNRGIC